LQIISKKIHEADKYEIKEESERYRAMCFLLRADDARYGELQDKLKKGVYEGHNKYPFTVSDAMSSCFAPQNSWGSTTEKMIGLLENLD